MQFQGLNLDDVQDPKVKEYLTIKNQSLTAQLMEDPKLNRFIEFAKYLFNHHFQDTLNKKEHDKLLIEQFDSQYIMSKLYGLELHKIRDCFTKFGNKLIPNNFILLIMKLISFELDEVPFIINGLRELAINIEKDGYISFENFITYYMEQNKDQELADKNIGHYSLVEAKISDNTFHRHEIQKVIIAESIQKIVLLEENQSEIILLNNDLQLMKKLSSENHIILDFDYADQTKEIMCSQSNNVLVVYSFIDQYIKKKIIKTDISLFTKVYYMTSVECWSTFSTSQQMYLWSKKDHICQKLNISFQGGKVQNIIEIQKNKMICIQTDLKRIHIFNYEFDQLIVIQDNLLIQSFVYYEQGQCFFSINFSHKIQKWLIEEKGIDYTKDKVYQICKPEYMVLALGFLDNIIITYDSSNHIRLFDSEEFSKLAAMKRILKHNNHMRILQIDSNKFAIVGNRISVFQINIKIDERQSSNVENQELLTRDHEQQLKLTWDIVNNIQKSYNPQNLQYRGTKHQGEIEMMLEKINGAKTQFLPRVNKKKQSNIPLPSEEYIQEQIDLVDKQIYTTRLMRKTFIESDDGKSIANSVQQHIPSGLMNLQITLNKIDQKQVEPMRITTRRNQKMDLLPQKQSIKSNDYLSFYIQKHNTDQSVFSSSRKDSMTKRDFIRKALFNDVKKAKYKNIKFNTQNPSFADPLPTQTNQQNPPNLRTFRLQPEIPYECLTHLEESKQFYNKAMSALNYIQSHSKQIRYGSKILMLKETKIPQNERKGSHNCLQNFSLQESSNRILNEKTKYFVIIINKRKLIFQYDLYYINFQEKYFFVFVKNLRQNICPNRIKQFIKKQSL